jgi:hypothetical protein
MMAVRSVADPAERSPGEPLGAIGLLILRHLVQLLPSLARLASFRSHPPIIVDVASVVLHVAGPAARGGDRRSSTWRLSAGHQPMPIYR